MREVAARTTGDLHHIPRLGRVDVLVATDVDGHVTGLPEDVARLHAAFADGAAVPEAATAQYQRKDWYARLGSDVTAEAIMDRIVHNATWMEVGDISMRERLSGRKDG